MPLDAPRIWQLDNAAINRLLHTCSGLTLVGWNDTSHLDVGAPTLDESADRMRSEEHTSELQSLV